MTAYWIFMGAAFACALFVLVGIPVVNWWFDYDRRPARWHPDECRCRNCNDYHRGGENA